MLHSSSPTLSTDRDRSSYARTHSPRFTVSSAPSRRFSTKLPPSPSPALSAAAPSPNKRKEYVDSATQYSPSGLPPTASVHFTHSAAAAAAAASASASHPPPPFTASSSSSPPPPPPPPDLTAPLLRGDASASGPAVTEPPEQPVRNGPPPTPDHDARKSSRGSQDQGESPQRPRHNLLGAVVPSEPSPAKRPRSLDANLKVMPRQYETCDMKDLGVLVSDMLMELVRLNDDMPLRDGQLTRFHSRAPPAISVKDYLFRLIVHATLSPPILLSMVFYVDKLCTMYPAFTISSLTVHRFLITAATVAAKGLSDSFWTNSLYAKVGGVSLRELALLEVEFLKRLEWRIVPKPETLVDYYKGLVDRGEGYVLEKETETTPAVTTPTMTTTTTTTTTNNTTGEDAREKS